MDNVQNEFNHASQLFSQNRYHEAEQVVRNILRETPENLNALNLLGSIAAMRGDASRAIDIFSNLTKLSPGTSQYHFNLGRCYQMQKNFVSARKAFEVAVQVDPQNLEAWVVLSRVYQINDELSACIDAANNVRRLASDDKSGQELKLEATITLSTAHLKRGEFDTAQQLLEQALEENSDDPRIHSRLGDVYRENDCNAKAAESFLKAADLRNDPLIDQMSAAIAYMRDSKLDDAYALLSECHAKAPGNQRVLSAYGPLLWEMGREEEYAALFDYQNKIVPVDVPSPPQPFPTMEAFHAALIRELRNHPTLKGNRVTKSTTGGLQTGNVFANPAPATAALMKIVNEQVSVFLGNRCDSGEFKNEQKTSDWNLIGWGVILQSQGYQSPHNHPSAMVSGVYYVQVPDEVRDDDDFPGCIEFGPPNESYRMSKEPPRHRFLAQEGRMYLFPSHFWHRTIPFESRQERICIAFDANRKPMAGPGRTR